MTDQDEHDTAEPADAADHANKFDNKTTIATDEHDSHNETLLIQSAAGTYLLRRPRSPSPSRRHATTTSPSTPTNSNTSSQHQSYPSSSPLPSPRAPSPPRWRFVKDAKKSLGYDSSAAGVIIDGMSSEELAAKYIPPRENTEVESERSVEIGKLDIHEDKDVMDDDGIRNDCLKQRDAFESRTGEGGEAVLLLVNGNDVDVDSDDGTKDIGDVEVGSDFDKQSSITTVQCAAAAAAAVLHQEDIIDNTNKKRRRKAFLLVMLLSIALFGMILGVTIETETRGEETDNVNGGEIQTSEALFLSDETTLNNEATVSPSPSQSSVNNADYSLPPASMSVIRPYPSSTLSVSSSTVTAVDPDSSTPTSEAPVSSSPTTTTPVSSTPTSESPVSSSPTTATPVSSTPTSESPVSSSPTTATPVSLAPTSKAPVSSSPTTATPVSSTPTSQPPTNTPSTLLELDSVQPPTSACPLAKKIKIKSTTCRPIQMMEVRVISNGVNIAIGKPASQSSDFVHNNGSVFYASYAVDGDLTTFSHTQSRGVCEDVWWGLDLERLTSVELVAIVNRYCSLEPACLCRLSYAVVQLFDEEDVIVAQASLGDTCGDHNVEVYFSSKDCSPAAVPNVPSLPPISPPSVSPIYIPQLEGYEYVGFGSCLDSENQSYDRYYTHYEGCEEKCVKNDAFRGINLEFGVSCNCLYEHGLLFNSGEISMEPAFDISSYQGGGTTAGGRGEIMSSGGSRDMLCYRYVGNVVSSTSIFQ